MSFSSAVSASLYYAGAKGFSFVMSSTHLTRDFVMI